MIYTDFVEVFLILFAIFCFTMAIYQINKKVDRKIGLKNQNIFLELPLLHQGGHPDLKSGQKILLQIGLNELKILNPLSYDLLSTIDFSQLNKYEINTEEQLQKSVTIPRFLILGIASLLVPKTTKNNNQYLYLQYTDSGVNVDCLFKNVNNEPIGDIISTINKLKIEQNKSISI